MVPWHKLPLLVKGVLIHYFGVGDQTQGIHHTR